MQKIKILLLVGKGESSNMLFHKINDQYSVEHVIEEEGVSAKKFFQRRIKKLGYFRVFGQLLFMAGLSPLIKKISKKRVTDLEETFSLNKSKIPQEKLTQVQSINAKESLDKISSINADLILINGTRIISKKILNSSKAHFVNIHAGITPKYRGVHGAYWAYYKQDDKNAGVTVHLVDAGIDTGGVLAQKIITKSKADNYATYPTLQFGEGLDLLCSEVIPTFMKDKKLESKKSITNESFLWSHPTIFQYLKGRISGVK